MLQRLAVLAIVAFTSFSAVAQTENVRYSFALRGEPSPNPRYTKVAVSIGVGGMLAVRVYSEPSHTLLAAFVDSSDGEFAAQPWFACLLPPRASQAMMASLSSGMKGSVQGPIAPSTDTHLMLHTLRAGTDGKPPTDELFKVTTPDLRNFAFTLEALDGATAQSAMPAAANSRLGTPAPNVNLPYRFTCGFDSGCSTATISCPTNSASCCWSKENSRRAAGAGE